MGFVDFPRIQKDVLLTPGDLEREICSAAYHIVPLQCLRVRPTCQNQAFPQRLEHLGGCYIACFLKLVHAEKYLNPFNVYFWMMRTFEPICLGKPDPLLKALPGQVEDRTQIILLFCSR